MRIKLLLVLLLVAMTSAMPAAVANMEILERWQYPLLNSLEDMAWQEDLSRDDTRKVIVALESKKDMLGEAAIRVVVLHKLAETVPILKKGVGQHQGANRILPRIIADAFARGADPLAYLRDAPLDEPLEDRQPYRRKLADRQLFSSEVITSIIVISEAKALRAGLKSEPDIAGRTLSPFHYRLLRYSRMDRTAAIDSMLAQISNIEIATTKEYETADILRTLGPVAVDAVLNRLSRAADRKDVSKYGLRVLFYFLNRKVPSMDTDMKQRALNILSRLDTEGSADLSRSVEFLRGELLE